MPMKKKTIEQSEEQNAVTEQAVEGKEIANIVVAEEKKVIQPGTVTSKSLLDALSSFSITEAYKATRTNLSFLLTGEDSKKIACFTSPSPGEGKTTTCANIAITFSQTNMKVLVIDADLRKPKMHKIFNLPSKPGLTNLLSGFCDISQAVRHTAYPNLDVLTAGNIPPNPTELLSSVQAKAMFERFIKEYDYIFVDSPPINIVTDVAVLSKYVTGIILVARQGITTTDTMKHAVESLQFVGANVLGFILNDINKDKYSYRYRYKYKGKSKYHYAYANNEYYSKTSDEFD